MHLYGGGIPFSHRIDLENPIVSNTRPVDIDAYKVYKSLDGITDFEEIVEVEGSVTCLLYTSPSPRDRSLSRMPSSA